jgi:NAD(P)-dependent dehydrogenase (short-subunit alcohol dehydrogenase family)
MTRVGAVTGGAGAIGGAIAAGLRAAGHQVVILDRDGDPPVDLAEHDAVRAAVAGTPPEAFAAVRARQAIGRDLTPGDIAAAVAFLVSDAAGAITGQTLCADGGLILR